MMLRRLLVLPLALLGFSAQADSIDFNIHDDALRLIYATGVGQASQGLEMEAGYFYSEEYREDIHTAHLGLHVAGENWSQQGTFDINLGGRLLYTETDTPVGDSLNLAVGGRVRFSPVNRFGIGAQVYYAPDILSFADGDSYLETGFSVDYQLLAQGFVYLGYRKIEIDFERADDVEIDDSGHIGMKLLF